jgi:ubiquinone/menaquinone biosynthesis C-methylase UbiE
MRRLADAHEHLDGALADRPMLAGNLRDLARINRVLGGTELSLRAVRALFQAPSPAAGRRLDMLRVLDVGTGAADIPVAMTRLGGPWRSVHVTAVDSRTEVIEGALELSPALQPERDVSLAVADGLALPYGDGAFHVAHASLVLHHLEPRDAVRFLRELARVASIGVVVNDLQRGVLRWLGAWLLLHLATRNGFTRHDGPLSVRRAYTRREAVDLLAEAGLRPIAEIAGRFGHRWAIAAVRDEDRRLMDRDGDGRRLDTVE